MRRKIEFGHFVAIIIPKFPNFWIPAFFLNTTYYLGIPSSRKPLGLVLRVPTPDDDDSLKNKGEDSEAFLPWRAGLNARPGLSDSSPRGRQALGHRALFNQAGEGEDH